VARTQYTPDEFDRLPEGTPSGVHRRIPKPWTRTLVFVAIVATAIGLGWGVAHVILISDNVSWLHWIRAPFEHSTASYSPIPSESPTVAVSPSPSESASPTVPPDLVLDANVVVFNDTGDGQVSVEVQSILETETGFTKVATGSWSGATPPANVIRYSLPQFADSANYIADLLGITSVETGPAQGADIAIILVKDLSPQPTPTPKPSST